MLFNGIAVKFEDVAKMCLFFMKNEDNLYPPSQGFKGAELFKSYMNEVLNTREIPKDKKYDIKKNKLAVLLTASVQVWSGSEVCRSFVL